MKFMHIADVHLGYQQYGLRERFDDFSKTFLHLTQKAIEENVDFIMQEWARMEYFICPEKNCTYCYSL